MIAVDTNVLVYANRSETPQHSAAREALLALAEGPVPWGLPVFVIGEFVRVVTNTIMFPRPTPIEGAVRAIGSLLDSPSVRLLSPRDGYWTILREYIVEGRAVGAFIFDAQIAAVCREHGAGTILTEDRDFHRFPGIKVRRLDGTER